MTPEVRNRLDRMLVANRVFIDALRARDNLLAETCESASKELDEAWLLACRIAEKAEVELKHAIEELKAVR